LFNLYRRPGQTLYQLSSSTRNPKGKVSYWLKLLMKEGVIETSNGKHTTYHLNKEAIVPELRIKSPGLTIILQEGENGGY
jgi:predicted transcriptional regulator